MIRYQITLTQCTVATFSYLETPIYFIGCLPFLTPLGRDSTITGLLDDFVKPILQKRSKLLLSCALKLSQLGPAASSSDAKALWHYSKAFYSARMTWRVGGSTERREKAIFMFTCLLYFVYLPWKKNIFSDWFISLEIRLICHQTTGKFFLRSALNSQLSNNDIKPLWKSQ